MKGKESPFANLLSKLQAGGPSGAAGTEMSRDMDEAGVEGEMSVVEAEQSSSEKSSDESSSETGSILSPTRDSNFQFGHSSFGDPISSPTMDTFRHSKKRKGDKPKKHSGGSSEMETIVHKKPKNLFMMMDFQRGFNPKSAEDEYNFDEDDDEMGDTQQMFNEYREPRKASPSPSQKSSHCDESQAQGWAKEDERPPLVSHGNFISSDTKTI